MTYTTLTAATTGLAPYGFDPALQARFAERAAAVVDNAVRGSLRPLDEAALPRLPALGSAARQALPARGEAAIRAGQVGVVVLAGGMATRFGGVVKAVVPAHDGASFLTWKHRDVAGVARALGVQIPMYVMSSFATHDTLLDHVAQVGLGDPAPVRIFPQRVALRLTPEGALFHDAEGALSPYATGHGDLVDALRSSGVLAEFRAAGGRVLFMTNVDNLGASLDPALVGLHLELGGAITAEVVRKAPGDAGGAPALLDGVPQIIEGFRFPPAFDPSTIGVFNTNTLWLDAGAVDRDFELPYYRVAKKVGGAPVIQFERLVGELTALVPSRFVEVSREGDDCRFIAVKDPNDLVQNATLIGVRCGGRGATVPK